MTEGKKVSRRWRTVSLLAAGIAIGAVMVATPAGAHVGGTVNHLWGHIKPKADARYANAVSGTDKAKDADMLDGVDSAAFQRRCQGGATLASGFVGSAGALSDGQSCLGDGSLVVTKTGTGVYEIDTNGFGCVFICPAMVATATANSGGAVIATWATDRVGESCDVLLPCFGGEVRLLVRTFNTAGTAVDNAFGFAIHS